MVDRLLGSKAYAEPLGPRTGWTSGGTAIGGDWERSCVIVRNISGTGEDWIIEALDRDKGYDQMVREMLAADELAPQRR